MARGGFSGVDGKYAIGRFKKNQVLQFSRAILSKHSIHYTNTMSKIFLKNIDHWGLPKLPKILMFLDENQKT